MILNDVLRYLECFDQYISSCEGIFNININVLGVISFKNGGSFNAHDQNIPNIYISNQFSILN